MVYSPAPLRAVVLAQPHPRFIHRAETAAAQIAALPGVELVGGQAHVCEPADVPGRMSWQAELVSFHGHTWYFDGVGWREEPVGFLGTHLDHVQGIVAEVVIADGCWTAFPGFLKGLAAAHAPGAPEAAVLACKAESSFETHDYLFPPLFEALLSGGRPTSLRERLETAPAMAIASKELRPHARKDWSRWVVAPPVDEL